MRITANRDERTISGTLLPFGEVGYTNVGAITVGPGALTIPDDVSSVHLNMEHDRTRPVGTATRLEETPAGIEATFSIAETTAGNDLLAEVASGLRNGFSVEFEDQVIRAGRALAGMLTGAAAVVAPAFSSARVMASDHGELPEWLQDTESQTVTDEEVIVDGKKYKRTTTSTYKTEVSELDAGDSDEDPTSPAEEPATDPVTASNQENPVTRNLANTAGGDVVTASTMTPRQAFRAIARGAAAGNLNAVTAALVNITHDDGDNDGDGLGEIAAPPAWLGEVFQDRAYRRRYIPLLTSGTLTSYREAGFRWTTKPVMAPYSGNKADVPSTGMSAERVDYGTQRWANAADLDRRFVDFGDQQVVQAFIESNIESYLEVTDLDALAQTIAGATPIETGAPVSVISPWLVQIVDGALALIAAGRTPTAAVVGTAAFRDLLLTPKDQIAEFLTQSMGLESGSLSGNFRIVPATNAELAAASLVIDGSTVRYKEFGGGVPVRVQAEHIAQGGVDVGVFGYTSHQVLKDDGAVLVSTAAEPEALVAPAADTKK